MSEVRLLYGKIVRHAQRHTNHKPVKTTLTRLSENQLCYPSNCLIGRKSSGGKKRLLLEEDESTAFILEEGCYTIQYIKLLVLYSIDRYSIYNNYQLDFYYFFFRLQSEIEIEIEKLYLLKIISLVYEATIPLQYQIQSIELLKKLYKATQQAIQTRVFLFLFLSIVSRDFKIQSLQYS